MHLLPILALAASLPTIASGQVPEGTARIPTDTATGPVRLLTTPGGAFGASLLLPGAGQVAQGRRRWLAYGALEAAFWTVRLAALAEERSSTRAYRDLAWEVARMPGSRPRQQGSWGYYETMSHYARSGAFDRDPVRPGVQPEEDQSTYNGVVWSLARALYLPGGEGAPGTPEHDRALTYYEQRAAGPAFLWNWEGAPDALDRFRALIGDADDAARAASAALGAVLANHLVSAVDALIVARIQSEAGARLESRLAPAGALRWSVGLRIPISQ